MEAHQVDALPVGDGWLYEPKWDGFRCLAFKDGTDVDLRAKSGKPLNRFFPELAAALARHPQRRFIVDGEIVIPLSGGLSFAALQDRLHPAASRVQRLARETPARLIAFDCLLSPADGPLIGLPLRQRRERLAALMQGRSPDPLFLSPATSDVRVARGWLVANSRSSDGVIAKALDAPYAAGERTLLKVKNLKSADCVVGGFRYGQGRRREVGSLLLGLFTRAGLLDHVGFCSGLADRDKPDLTRRLEAISEPPGFTGRAPGGPSRWSTERSADWVPLRPELVVEVRYDHVTDDRFRHGTKLLRWRPDKAPAQCSLDQIAPADGVPEFLTDLLGGAV